MTMSNHEISVAADKAADYIEEHGLTKGVFKNRDTGSVCIRGALNTVAGTSAYDREAGDQIGILVAEYLGFEGYFAVRCDLPEWNNADERTQEEVVEVLRNVATKYRDDAMHG